MRSKFFLASGAMVFVWCCATTMAATSGRPVDIPERARGAQKVVVATATTVVPTWRQNAFGDDLIVSEVGLQIEETLKGTPAGFVLLDLEGGTMDGLTMRVSTLPTLEPGERAIFFLNSTPRGSHVPHLKGLGILKLNSSDQVIGSSLRLEDVRRMSKGAR